MINCLNVSCFAAQNKSKKILLKSSSGGIFYILAKHFLDIGGYVCGATFDSQGNVFHIITNDIANLENILTSKYVRSDLRDSFSKIKELLNDGKWVLFCGTPCQAAALSFFLKDCARDRLLVVDLVCHGTPAPKYWKSFLSANKVKNVSSLNFRNKRPSWERYSLEINSKIFPKKDSDCYMNLFLRNYILTPSCYQCRYKGFNRYSDITLCDFWGHNKSISNLRKRYGISGLIINNPTGQKYVEIIRKDANLFPCTLFDITRINNSYFESATVPADRDAVISNINWSQNKFAKPSVANALDKMKNNAAKAASVLLLNYKNTRTAYCKSSKQNNTVIVVTSGSKKPTLNEVMATYSLKTFFENRGVAVRELIPMPPARGVVAKLAMIFGAQLINRIKRIRVHRNASGIPSEKCPGCSARRLYFSYLKSDKNKLNKARLVLFYGDIWKLDGAKFPKLCAGDFGITNERYKKIGFAISSNNSLNQQKFESLFADNLHSFSAISFEGGCNDGFSKEAPAVLNPIFLLGSDEWNLILQPYSKNHPSAGSFVFVCCKHKSESYGKTGDRYIKSNSKVVNLSGGDFRLPSSNALNLISYIKDAEVVVTDSYILIAFAILFGKRICLCPSGQKQGSQDTARLKSMFSLFDIDLDQIKDSVFDSAYLTKTEKFSMYREETIRFLDSVLKEDGNP